ncbi:MAG: 4-hydroxy-3-methylbut-2-enyl diphosphate reductase, partial [Oscillospiraceae bacterium]
MMAIITVAKTAGFCFGVNRAVNLVYDLIEQKKVSTLGPIIHNSQMVADLESRGVTVIDNLSQAKPDVTVVIRSHGVGNDIYRELEQMKQPFVDATCPFVAKIHKIVERESSEGATIIIAGDENHPEVQGIIGHCKTKAYVVNKAEDLEQLSNNLEIEEKNNCILLAQTTYNTTFWENLIKNAKKLYTNIKIFDTICSATSERQSEAVQLASENNLMVVIGGRHSSNTKKLAQVCLEHCKTVLIETASELSNINLFNFDKIGVTAGASTPAYIIKEVLTTMSEILQNDDEELDFAQLLEQSLETEKLYNGKRVKGIVTTVAANEVHVDIGAKQAGIIPASELSDDPNIKIDELVKKGDELDLCVVKVNDQEGIVTLSKKRCDAQAGLDKLKAACESGEILSGVITDVVRGGVLVFSNNLKVFVPASQVSDKRVENLETLIKTPVEFKVLEVNDRRGRALGSIRAVMSEQRKANEAKIWDSIEVGKEYKGEVKSITSYGAFVDIGGIDGMVHITELSWLKIKHPSEVVSVGDVIDVYIKS